MVHVVLYIATGIVVAAGGFFGGYMYGIAQEPPINISPLIHAAGNVVELTDQSISIQNRRTGAVSTFTIHASTKFIDPQDVTADAITNGMRVSVGEDPERSGVAKSITVLDTSATTSPASAIPTP